MQAETDANDQVLSQTASTSSDGSVARPNMSSSGVLKRRDSGFLSRLPSGPPQPPLHRQASEKFIFGAKRGAAIQPAATSSISSFYQDGGAVAVDPTPSKVLKINHNPYTPPTSGNGANQGGNSAAPEMRVSVGTASRYLMDYQTERTLGKGSYGNVELAKHRVDGWSYAIKKLRYRHNSYNPHALDTVLNEIFMLASLSHPHIIRYHSAWIEEEVEGLREKQVCIATEFCYGGSLTSWWKEWLRVSDLASILPPRSPAGGHNQPASGGSRRTAFSASRSQHIGSQLQLPTHHRSMRDGHSLNNGTSDRGLHQPILGFGPVFPQHDPATVQNAINTVELKLCEILKQVCKALRYLHEEKCVVHFDVKPDNIFVQQETLSMDSATFKLGDCGSMRKIPAMTTMSSPRGGQQHGMHMPGGMMTTMMMSGGREEGMRREEEVSSVHAHSSDTSMNQNSPFHSPSSFHMMPALEQPDQPRTPKTPRLGSAMEEEDGQQKNAFTTPPPTTTTSGSSNNTAIENNRFRTPVMTPSPSFEHLHPNAHSSASVLTTPPWNPPSSASTTNSLSCAGIFLKTPPLNATADLSSSAAAKHFASALAPSVHSHQSLRIPLDSIPSVPATPSTPLIDLSSVVSASAAAGPSFATPSHAAANGLIMDSDDLDGDGRYLAPELLESFQVTATELLPKADIYALGCSIVELAHVALIGGSGEMVRPEMLSSSFKALLDSMMDYDPSKRPSASDILQHDLLKSPEDLHMQRELRRLAEKVKELEAQNSTLRMALLHNASAETAAVDDFGMHDGRQHSAEYSDFSSFQAPLNHSPATHPTLNAPLNQALPFGVGMQPMSHQSMPKTFTPSSRPSPFGWSKPSFENSCN
jgi:serine/threonine protein kinase